MTLWTFRIARKGGAKKRTPLDGFFFLPMSGLHAGRVGYLTAARDNNQNLGIWGGASDPDFCAGYYFFT